MIYYINKGIEPDEDDELSSKCRQMKRNELNEKWTILFLIMYISNSISDKKNFLTIIPVDNVNLSILQMLAESLAN